MGKTMTREQRKNNKYSSRDFNRKKKYSNVEDEFLLPRKKDRTRQKRSLYTKEEID